jgi:hypothetical protein
MTRVTTSFLDGTEWVLRTRVMRSPDAGVTLTHDATIRATAQSRAQWTSQFWRLFPTTPGEFRTLVSRGQVNVKVMFRFRPTVRMKQRYGDHPVLKIARTAEGWRDQLHLLPQPLAHAIEDYDRDKRLLQEQRQQAWLELLHLRLPKPPAGYEWKLTSGDPRFYGDLLNFQLKVR